MPSAITMSGAVSANIQILQLANEQFQVTQKRVSTGKWVFGASDDTTRYKMSETMLGRSRQIEDINNNISLGLKTLDTTDKTLKQMISLVESAQNLARKAQAEGAAGLRSSSMSGTSIINATTAVAGYTAGPAVRLSITSDTGQNFTYFLNRTGVTWGEIVDALNSANIGVQAEFVPSTSTTPGQSNIRFMSTNGKDFKFDGISDQSVMDDLVGLTGSGMTTLTAALAANYFGATGVTTANETGFTVGFGGQAVGTKTNPTTFTPSNSTLVFKDGNGAVRTYNASTSATNVAAMISEFNTQFQSSGVVAELANVTGTANTILRFRNTNGGNMELVAGTTDFATGAANLGLTVPTVGFAAPLSSNNVLRLQYGVQYDNIVANLNQLVAANPVQSGRNLLAGQNMAVVMDEFAGTPITVTGVNITAAGTLTMAQAGTGWTNDTAIQTSATQSNQALINLRNYQGNFATFSTYMKERYDANMSYKVDLKTLGDELVAADMAEESANMTALQTRQQFAVQAFSLGSQVQQGLLRLLG